MIETTETQTITTGGPQFDKVRPAKWKHHHKWPAAWKVWITFVQWVFDAWPRNP